MNPDDLKRIWQAQPAPGRLTIDADVLLQQLRRNKRSFAAVTIWSDVFIILSLLVGAAFFAGFAILIWVKGIPKYAATILVPALICIGIAVYKTVDRVRQMKRRPSVSDPILACAEEHLALVQHEIRLWNAGFWWFLLPLNLGILAFFVVANWLAGSLFSFSMVGYLLGPVIYTFAGKWCFRWYVQKYYEPRRMEILAVLESLRANTEREGNQPR